LFPERKSKLNKSDNKSKTKGVKPARLETIMNRSAWSAPFNNYAAWMLRHETYGCVHYGEFVFNLDDEFERCLLMFLLVLDGIIRVIDSKREGHGYDFHYEFIHPDLTYMNVDVSRSTSGFDRRNNMQEKAMLYNLYGKLLIPLTDDEYKLYNREEGETHVL